jgi:hypothetical protein
MILGLPSAWKTVLSWLSQAWNSSHPATRQAATSPSVNDNLPTLVDYSTQAPDSFWTSFPSYDIPKKPETNIDIPRLENLVTSNSKLLLRSEIKRGLKCIDYLSNGAPAFQSRPLGPCIIKNSQNAITHGESVTNTIANWVSKKIRGRPIQVPTPSKLQGELNPGSSPDKQNKSLHQRIPTIRKELQ